MARIRAAAKKIVMKALPNPVSSVVDEAFTYPYELTGFERCDYILTLCGVNANSVYDAKFHWSQKIMASFVSSES